MSSLQRPRKISVWGDDGNVYGFLCKEGDDLRKDSRLMEFVSFIIKLLKKDSEARKRKLCACLSPAMFANSPLIQPLLPTSHSTILRRPSQREVRTN